MDEVLDAAERLALMSRPLSGVEWLEKQHRVIAAISNSGPWPAPLVRLETISLAALRVGNGAVFWPSLQIAGEAFLRAGWPLPRSDGLAYLVRAYADVAEFRKMPYVTTAEAAQVLGYTDRHVRRLVKCGRLRAKRMPAGYLEVDNDDVHRLAKEKAK